MTTMLRDMFELIYKYKHIITNIIVQWSVSVKHLLNYKTRESFRTHVTYQLTVYIPIFRVSHLPSRNVYLFKSNHYL